MCEYFLGYETSGCDNNFAPFAQKPRNTLASDVGLLWVCPIAWYKEY